MIAGSAQLQLTKSCGTIPIPLSHLDNNTTETHCQMPTPSATMSFQRSRQALLNRMSAKSRERVSKVIRFRNNDVPEFLKNLDRFETQSRRKRLVAR